MLLFISDLHFVDGLAGKHNIPTRAFSGALEDLKDLCKDPEEIKIVFLGDVFDLLRTTYWLDLDESERPWGDMVNKRAEIEEHANVIMDKILDENRDTFDLFSGSLVSSCGLAREPERVYIPGNHDRLCNIFPSLRDKVRQHLGMPPSKDSFPYVYDDGKYGVFARHGHEYDSFNYEGSTNYTDVDYAQVPIGDVITTEIAARLPYAILKEVDKMSPPLSEAEREALQRNLEEIENVRPLSAIFQWLFYQVRENPQVQNEINEAVRGIADNFNGLDSVRRWYKKHHDWNIFSPSEADKLHAAIDMCKLFKVDACEELVKIFSKVFGSSGGLPEADGDQELIKQAQVFLSRRSDYSYMVMGHTHNPLQVPMRITSTGKEQVYLNTGTWRQRNVQGRTNGFIGVKYITYTVFYSPDENGTQSFETWTGSLKE